VATISERLTTALADRYCIERELGAGGMATVYLAEDLKHRRRVAVKVLKPELAAVLGADRFVQEITTTAALQHPHILPLFDSGEADGFLFYVMPFIDGETLRAKLDRETQLGVDEAVRIACDVADALHHAHSHGVIHRDIKPENILLANGRPMVADFGIALAVSAAAGGRMTETGLSLGTPHYMSPEQATAEKEIGARSDVYSLASVLYEMLSGQPPHTGVSAQQIIMKIITEQPAAVTSLRKAVPPNVAAAVAQALEKLPADRFASAQSFAHALTDVHFTTATAAGSAATALRGSNRVLTAALGAALVVMTIVAGGSWLRPPAPGPVIRYRLALPEEQKPDPYGFALATSDGSRIIFVGPSISRRFLTQLWVKTRDAATAVPLDGTDAPSSAAISPDDKWIAVVQGRFLRRVPITGGSFTQLAEDASNVLGSVAWLDDGTLVYATSGRSALVRIPADGGPGTEVWASDTLRPHNLTALPGGRGVLFHACPAPCDRGDLWVLDLRSGTARPLMPDVEAGFYVATGHLVFIDRNQAALAVPFSLRSLETRGTPVGVIDSVAMGIGSAPYFSVSTRGTLVMRRAARVQRQQFELVWVDRSGEETRVDSTFTFRVTQFAGNHGWSLSPDGSRLAIGLNTASGDDIWIKTLPRGPVSRVTYGTGAEMRPRWTPDGRFVTFVSSAVFMRRADGIGTDSLLSPAVADEAVISPDGAWLVLRAGATSAAAGGRDILGLRLGTDTVPVPLVASQYDENAVAISPDSRWLAYESDESSRAEIYIRPFPNTGDGRIQVSSGGGTAPLWARDGSELFYLRHDNMMMAAPVLPGTELRFGEHRELFPVRGALAFLGISWYTPWDVAPDGRFIMVRSVDSGAQMDSPLIVVENWFEELKQKVAR
jgi:eukaryotic-like serine/threonine-protein kinase